MEFVIDETSLRFHSLSYEQISRSLSALAQLIRGCREDACSVWYSGKIYEQTVFDGCRLYELLFDHTISSNVHRDVLQLFQIEIDRSSVWEEEVTIEDHSVKIGADEIVAPSVAFAADRTCTVTESACVVSDVSKLIGPIRVSHAGRNVDLSFVSSAIEKTKFYRHCLDCEARNETEYMNVAPIAFPNLIFADELSVQFRRFKEPYSTIHVKVTRHLSALNDELPRIIELPPDEIQARIKASGQVDLSRESPQTHQNKRAMRERMVVVQGYDIVCEWHTKISPTTDRIHLHFGLPDLGGKPIIGLFVDHLDT